MAEKKGRRKAATAAVPSAPGARDIGIDVPSPAKVWTDRKCPFHGGLPVRGQMLEGVVVSTRIQNTVVIEREYLRYFQKFDRCDEGTRRLNVRAPACLGLRVGH